MSIDLTDAELERLSILAEECGEVIQAISKIIRFGKDGIDPKIPSGGNNSEKLSEELGNVYNAMDLCSRHGDVDFDLVKSSARNKRETIVLNHQD